MQETKVQSLGWEDPPGRGYEENSASCWYVAGKARSILMDFSNSCEFHFLHISQVQQMIVSSRLVSVWNFKSYPCAFHTLFHQRSTINGSLTHE